MLVKDFDFRVWNNVDKEYIQTPSIVSLSDSYTDNRVCNEVGKTYTNNEREFVIDVSDKEECELELWSGFYDKNGVKIYEGDIVKIENSVGVIEFSLGIGSCVRYCGKSISLGALHPYIEKVIGNIHENPELLDKAYIMAIKEREHRERLKQKYLEN